MRAAYARLTWKYDDSRSLVHNLDEEAGPQMCSPQQQRPKSFCGDKRGVTIRRRNPARLFPSLS